ncbi:hypothetical protein AGABI2DRAFT_139268 [Agaricus bisporus var. bisporus H97]|uniref:hypothetical protein n=1 Tax=Agaricus bisporus var. bisporus (strain H97 / ATCC MYA-4626 / FGSC 10389) TaxID=936046 RepID=UPI00029F73C9|nr:hypothetical protein AGABI2DRAFT_139268 [Agaricus bisporus var. bisporus H97]EKV42876.1 hypothetical protein AGABI2DRAFT_139268 [Agaricus bisporus var. bisporus H97]
MAKVEFQLATTVTAPPCLFVLKNCGLRQVKDSINVRPSRSLVVVILDHIQHVSGTGPPSFRLRIQSSQFFS